MRGWIGVALGLVCQFVAADELRLHRDANAGPGQSQNTPLVYAESSLVVSRTAGSDEIRVNTPVGSSPTWSLTFKGIDGTPVQPLCYERAQRSAFADPGRPGLAFSFGGIACNSVRGRFRVLQIERDSTGLPTALAVDFAQHCEGRGPAVYGQVRYNSNVPTVDAKTLRPVVSASGALAFTAEQGAVGHGTNNGGVPITRNIPFTHAEMTGRTDTDSSVNFSFRGPVSGLGDAVSSSLTFAAADRAALTIGSYPNAERYPFHTSARPGLDFSFNGGGCNTLSGNFSVGGVSFDSLDGFPTHFSANFDQRCNALTQGTLDYTASVYQPVSDPTVVHRTGFEDDEASTSLIRGCSI